VDTLSADTAPADGTLNARTPAIRPIVAMIRVVRDPRRGVRKCMLQFLLVS
jgi:hypothetical protein